MAAKGYGTYHGRSRLRTALKVVIVLLVVLLVLAVATLLLMDGHIVYSSDGIRLDLPFVQKGGAEDPPEPAGSAPLVIDSPVPTPAPTATPEPETLMQGVLLPREALYDGTAEEQVRRAGAAAAVFDMKADDGSLGYISSLEPAQAGGVSAADPAINGAIRGLNAGELYTVARVSCFRDNAIPRADMSLGIKSSAGNWRDEGDCRWLSAANAAARQYVIGVCAELAELGFDELLLENCAFPARGQVDYIVAGENYDPAGLPAGRLVPVTEAPAGAGENWAVLTRTPTE